MARDCPICLEVLKNPVVCPCPGRHSFCRRCLRGLRQFHCPVCRDASDDVVYFVFKKSEPLTERDKWRAEHMVNAAQNGHFQVVRALLKLGCAVDHEQDGEMLSRTALQLASFAGKHNIVQLLLEWHASANKIDTFGLTALHLAVMCGHSNVARELIHAGAYKNKRTHNDETPLHTACYEGHLEIVKLLLSERADINNVTLAAETPLHAAATFPHSCEVVQYLIEEMGLSPGTLDDDGNAALHVACLDGAVHTVDYLFDYCLLQSYELLNQKNRFGCTPLILASGRNGHIEIVRRLISERASVNSTNSRGMTALTNASGCGHYDIFTYILVHGGNVRAVDKSGDTALHYASWNGSAQIVRSLLFHRANVDQRGNLDRSPLAQAVSKGHAEVVDVLLAARASVNRFARSHGRGLGVLTPLQIALAKKHTSLVPSLIQHKASVNKSHRSCLATPMHLACQLKSVETVQMLLESKANATRKGERGRSPLHCCVLGNQLESTQRLIQAGVSVNQVDFEGMTALHHSVTEGFVDMVAILLQAKASVNKANIDGVTPLMLAVETGRAPAKKGLGSGRARSLSILKALIEAKARLEVREFCFGETPLMCAASNKDLGMVKLLVEAGAEVSKAQDIARLSGDTCIERILERADNSNRVDRAPTKRRRQA